MACGHVFVVKGRIGEMVADAAIVSTDTDFSVRSHWRDIVSPDQSFSPGGHLSVEDHRPPDWPARGWGRSPANNTIWFVNVTADIIDGRDGFDRVRSALQNMADSGLTSTIKGRPMPLVVLPVIGTRGGGFDRRRGEVIDRLLSVCREFVGKHPIDVAVVAPDVSSHAALQHRRRDAAADYFTDAQIDAARKIGEAARDGSLALFIGAGTSIPAGAPSWEQLIQILASEAELEDAVKAGFKTLSPLDQAELLFQKLCPALGKAVAALVDNKKPALAHLLLAALGCQSAVTTNYDSLYEDAVISGGGNAATVLPTEIPRADSRWLLKMHGDRLHPEGIVLTRGQFVGFTTASGPAGAVLQALLLTKHLLVVGTSMTDDNVLRLIHEVAAYRHGHEPKVDGLHQQADDHSLFGTILDVDGNQARRALHSTHFAWHAMEGKDLPDRARQLEIFLDAVAMYAAGDHSWLLDERFSALHHSGQQGLADRARRLAAEVRAAAAPGSAWNALANQLERFGAHHDDRSPLAPRLPDHRR